MKPDDEREAKLPAWVRTELINLRNKIAEQSNIIAIARNEALARGCTGKVIAEDFLRGGFPLHDRAFVDFHLPNGKVSCMLRDNGSVLDLNASGSILIHPRAANCAYILVQP